MEEQRIGYMYLNLWRARFRNAWHAMFGRGLRRSSLLPVLVVLAIVIPVVGYSLHVHGKFHQAKTEMKGGPVAPEAPKPGGEEAMKLTRQLTPGSNAPEFLSMTLLPGLGMDVLQVSASLPGRGEVELFSAPTVDQMAAGVSDDRTGANDVRGAIELPWSGSLSGVLSPLATSLSTTWRGRTLELPVSGTASRSVAEGGLLMDEALDASMTRQGDGAIATAKLHDSEFQDRWPSHTDLSLSMELQAQAIDLVVTAKNTGNEPEPMGIGWHPRFLVPSGDRDSAELKLPNGQLLEVTDRIRDLPTGRIIEPPPSVARMQEKAAPVGVGGLDESLVNIKSGSSGAGPSAEFRDPASGYGLRVTALSSSIRQLRVLSPPGSRFVSLGMQTNLDDPFGKQWTNLDGGGITVLQPGQSLEWRVRLEIFAVAKKTGAAQ